MPRSCERRMVMHSGNTMTQLHFQEMQNINSIMARYKRTGRMESGVQGTRTPQFGNYVGVDFQAMQNTIANGMQAFAQLPVAIRRRFGFDAGNLVEWLQHEENREEAIKLGFIEKPKVEATQPAAGEQKTT